MKHFGLYEWTNIVYVIKERMELGPLGCESRILLWLRPTDDRVYCSRTLM